MQATSIAPSIAQEFLESAKNAAAKGQSQFFTPLDFAATVSIPLPRLRSTVVDLNCGNGQFLAGAANDTTTHLLGADIDPCRTVKSTAGLNDKPVPVQKIAHDLTLLAPLMAEVEFAADLFVLNPPWGLHWYKDRLAHIDGELGKQLARRDPRLGADCVDSTVATWTLALHHMTDQGEGALIANNSTLDRLVYGPGAIYPELAEHTWARIAVPGNPMTRIKDNAWESSMQTAIVYFARSHYGGPDAEAVVTLSSPADLEPAIRRIAARRPVLRMGCSLHYYSNGFAGSPVKWEAMAEEVRARSQAAKPQFNLWLKHDGSIGTYLSLFERESTKVDKFAAQVLFKLTGRTPASLILMRNERDTLERAAFGDTWKVDPALQTAIRTAVGQYHAIRSPLYPLPEIQRLGYLDEHERITCRHDVPGDLIFKPGVDYPLSTETVSVTRSATRINTAGEPENIEYSGQELAIKIRGEDGNWHCFMEGRLLEQGTAVAVPIDYTLQDLVQCFIIPEVPDVSTTAPELYGANLAALERIEAALAGRVTAGTPRFKTFQRQDYARMAIKPGGILGHDTGLGKSWASYTLPLLKLGFDTHPSDSPLTARGSVLLVAPGGLHRQLIDEARDTFGIRVTHLDSQATFLRLSSTQPDVRRTLPPGYYITSYTELGRNGVTPTKKDPETGEPIDPDADGAGGWHTVKQGGVSHRFKCVKEPTLSDLAIRTFDCVVVDEGTRLKGGFGTLIASGVLQLQPAYRFVLTATPIKNRLPDLFPLAWWATGGLPEAHAGFPYALTDAEDFAATFCVSERNLTAEARAKNEGKKNSRRVKRTPQVCNVHRLWKLNGPIVLRRRKKDVGEGVDIVPKTRHLIRAPLGRRQAALYAQLLQWCPEDKNGKPAIGAQLQALRMATSSPTSGLLPAEPRLKCGVDPMAYTPKLHTALTLILQILQRGEQVVVFSAFHDPLDVLSHRLRRAGVQHIVLDGRLSEKRRGELATQFKAGHIPILLASTECMSEGYSFHRANNNIFLDYCWAADRMEQADNRTHRLNSIKPVNSYRIICQGSIDRRLEQNIQEKSDAAELVLDGHLLGETPQEVNLAQLIAIAQQEFAKGNNTIEETDLETEWPALEASLRTASSSVALAKEDQRTDSPTAPKPTRRTPTIIVTTPVNIILPSTVPICAHPLPSVVKPPTPDSASVAESPRRSPLGEAGWGSRMFRSLARA